MAKGDYAIERIHPPRWLMRIGHPLMRRLAQRRPEVQNFVIVLHYRGRKTGRRYDLPVGYRLVDGRIVLLTNSDWRHNFRGGAEIEVTYRSRRQPANATLIEDPEVVAGLYERKYAELDRRRALRELGVRVNRDGTPTREAWLEVIKREGCRSSRSI